MPADRRLPVVFLWHMHQPDYRDLSDGRFRQPWTYLRAIKDYTDMAAHLEAVPGARAVVNFVPILIEQLEAYRLSLTEHLHDGSPLCDPHLQALADPSAVPPAERWGLMQGCLRAHELHMIGRHAPYAELAQWVRRSNEQDAAYLSDQFLADILVWWHLAWLGETVQRSDLRVRALMNRGRLYEASHRRTLLELIAELIGGIVPRYRGLAESGRVELCCSPYTHPILPLLIDLQCAAETLPHAPLPAGRYPGGSERARWQVRKGLEVFERAFGFKPVGCWPSEAAMSQASAELLASEGLSWMCGAGQVLHNSYVRAGRDHGPGPHRAYRAEGTQLACVFRDDGLSDLIGFTYSGWQAEHAVSDLLGHLERIAAARADDPDALVVIALDGENPWEHYPDNGYHFLRELYGRLSQHPQLALGTFGQVLVKRPPSSECPPIAAGSWVHGTLSTWIGEPSKNRAWEWLCRAKQTADMVLASLPATGASRNAIEHALAVCEGSDWFWWLGDYNPAQTVAEFDELYRRQLKGLYHMLGEVPPAWLDETLSNGSRGAAPATGGVMRPSQEHA